MELKISVMVPVYNTSKYLKKCLESISTQSLKDIEIIVVNDGSTDKSLEIIKEFKEKDNRIIIINKKNGGLTSARNAALEVAQGKYCLNVDSDDYIEKDYLEDLYKRAEKDNLDMVISNIIFSYENKKKNYILNDLNIIDTEIIDGIEYLKKFYIKNPYGYTWNKLIRREIYVKYDLKYNEKIFMLEDMELIGRLSYFCKRIGKVNKAYYNYRQGGNPSNLVTEKNLLDRYICYCCLKEFYLKYEELEILKLLKRNFNLKITRSILKNEYGISEKTKQILKEYLESIKKDDFIFFRYKNDFKNKNFILIIIFNILKVIIKLKR